MSGLVSVQVGMWIDEALGDRFNLVHPVPTFDNATALELVLDRMEELGLWLIYDMRW